MVCAHRLDMVSPGIRRGPGRAALVESARVFELAVTIIAEEIRRVDRVIGLRHRLRFVMQIGKGEGRASLLVKRQRCSPFVVTELAMKHFPGHRTISARRSHHRTSRW